MEWILLCLYSSQAHQYRNRELGADKLFSRGEFGKSFQVSRIEVSVPSGREVYCLMSGKESDTDPENSSPLGRQADRQMCKHTGRVQEEQQAVGSRQKLQRENTVLKIARHQRDGKRGAVCPWTHAHKIHSMRNTFFKPCAGNT